jgi:hypothetical protein
MSKVRKPACLAVVIALAALLVVGCGSGPKEPGRYYSDSWDYSIKFPAGWELEEINSGAVVSAYCPLEDDYDILFESVTVSVEDLPFSVDLDEYYTAAKRLASSEFLYFTEEQVEDIVLHGTRAKKIVFTYQDEGETLKSLGYCIVKGDRAYFITCVTEEYVYPEYAADFEQAAESIRFE